MILKKKTKPEIFCISNWNFLWFWPVPVISYIIPVNPSKSSVFLILYYKELKTWIKYTPCFNFLRQNKASSLSLSFHIMCPTISTVAPHWIPSLQVFMCFFYRGALNWVKHFRCSFFLFWKKVSLLLYVKKCKGMWGLVWSRKTQLLHLSFYSDLRQKYIWKISAWFLDCNLIWTEILSKVTSHPAHKLSFSSYI